MRLADRLAVRWIAAVLLLLGLAPRLAAAAASQATDLCAASADPCVVTADVTVAPNATKRLTLPGMIAERDSTGSVSLGTPIFILALIVVWSPAFRRYGVGGAA